MKSLLAAPVLLLALASAAWAQAVPTAPAPANPAPGTAAPANAAPPAAEPRLSNFVDLVFSGTTGESAPLIDGDFATGLTLGTAPLLLEKTRLDDLATQFGGTIHARGDAGDTVSWLCYTQHARTKADTPRTVWFTSTGEMAGSGHTLSMVAVENVDAAKVSGCLTAPKAFAFPSFGMPSIGTRLTDLKAKFPELHRDKQGNVYFDSVRPLGDGTGASVYQALGYRLTRKGVVSAVAISQVTTH